MGPVLLGRCPNAIFSLSSLYPSLFLSCFAEIRGFKVLSYISFKELPICSQVIRGKQSWDPRPANAKLRCSHRAAGSPAVHIVQEHRGVSAEQTAPASFDVISNIVILKSSACDT